MVKTGSRTTVCSRSEAKVPYKERMSEQEAGFEWSTVQKDTFSSAFVK